MTSSALPRVAILLATHNGEAYLEEQLTSIRDQDGVALTIFVSDDNSSDATRAMLRASAAEDERIRLLPSGIFGGAAANFYRLLREVDFAPFDAIGFADQDDVWMPGKLASHARLLRERGADGVSSNVTAFHASGERVLIRKDYPQRLTDFVFETPGPGSSFLLTQRLAQLVQAQLLDDASPAREAVAHDWLIYALARSAGWRWVIDPTSTIDYRQHDRNVVGANSGLAAAAKRLRLSAQGWHRAQTRIVVDACIRVASPEELGRLLWLREVLVRRTPTESLRLARRAGQFRRRPRDRAILAALMAVGLW